MSCEWCVVTWFSDHVSSAYPAGHWIFYQNLKLCVWYLLLRQGCFCCCGDWIRIPTRGSLALCCLYVIPEGVKCFNDQRDFWCQELPNVSHVRLLWYVFISHQPVASQWRDTDRTNNAAWDSNHHRITCYRLPAIVTTLLESAVRCEFPARVFLRGKLDNNAAWIPSLVTLLLSVRCCASMRCGFKAVNTIGWKLLDWCCDLHLREILMFFTYTTALMAWMRQKKANASYQLITTSSSAAIGSRIQDRRQKHRSRTDDTVNSTSANSLWCDNLADRRGTSSAKKMALLRIKK